MSQIEAFGTDLDTLALQLQEWISASQQTTDRLNEESPAIDQAHAGLDSALASAERQSSELQTESQALQHACEQFAQQLDSASHALQQGFSKASERCLHDQQTLSTASDSLRQGAVTLGGRLQTAHHTVGSSYSSLAVKRHDYSEQTKQHHGVAHHFLDSNQARLKTEHDRVGNAADASGGQLKAMAGELDHHLKGFAGAALATSAWLEHDMHQAVSGMVQARLDATLGHLASYGNQVQTFQNDAHQFGQALTSTVQKLVHDLPETVRKQGLNPVLELGKDLAINQIIETLGVIMIGAGISSACVGAMPVLKVIEAALRGILNISSLAATGHLQADDPDAYEDTPLAAGGSLGPAAALGAGGLMGAVNLAVGKLDQGLAAVGQGAGQVVAGVQQVVNQGAHRVEDFIHELFCPLCGMKCEVVG